MTVQELKDFLESIDLDPDLKIKVLVDGSLRTPRITYSPGKALRFEVPPKRVKKVSKARKKK